MNFFPNNVAHKDDLHWMFWINTIDPTTLPEQKDTQPENWRKIVRKYQTPSTAKAMWQVTNSFGPYAALWALMYFTRTISWPLTLLLASISALFLLRIFIILHDCGHGSFLKTRKANNIVGFLAGVLTVTPYRHWTWQHAVHHGTSGNLDERGLGDIWVMTVEEYQASPKRTQFIYRIVRNPIIMFVLAPVGLMMVYQRFPDPKSSKRERKSVHIMNFSLLLYGIGMSMVFGFWHFMIIQIAIVAVSGGLGIWLFYVQHQYENTYWRSGEEWDYATSAMEGSSFYKLPAVLNWFSGNIGYHHIHHLSSRIPNYHLKACHEAEPYFQTVPELTLIKSFKSMGLRLWDEDSQKLVGFGFLRGQK